MKVVLLCSLFFTLIWGRAISNNFIINNNNNNNNKWQKTNPLVGLDRVQSVVEVDGTITMLQNGNLGFSIYYSKDDGKTWLPGSLTSSYYYYPSSEGQMYYANNQYVIVNSGNVTFFSSNGFDFVGQPCNASVNFPAYIPQSNRFIALDNKYSVSYWSENGVEWIENPLPATYFYGMYHTFDLFIYGGMDSNRKQVYYLTTDGVEWNSLPVTSVFGQQYQWAEFYSGDVSKDEDFVYVYPQTERNNPTIFTSTDHGATWQLRESNVTGTPLSLTYSCGYYLANYMLNYPSHAYYSVLISTDLKSWTTLANPPFPSPLLFGFPDMLFAAGYAEFAVTKDLKAWYQPQYGIREYLNGLFALENGGFVIEGFFDLGNASSLSNKFFETTDGKTFTPLSPPPFADSEIQQWNNNDGSFSFFTSRNGVFTTKDFKSWAQSSFHTPLTCGSKQQLLNVDSNWVLICTSLSFSSQTVEFYRATAQNAIIWKKTFTSDGVNNEITSHEVSGAAGNSVFVINVDGVVRTSSDGVTWDISYSTDNNSEIAHTGKSFFLFNKGQVLTSSDGKTWSALVLPFTVAAWGKGQIDYIPSLQLYVALGVGQIATSSDLKSWDVTVLPNALLIIANVEYTNDVWLAIDNYAGIYVESSSSMVQQSPLKLN